MGIKFLNMQMILQLMGNHISCVHVKASEDHHDHDHKDSSSRDYKGYKMGWSSEDLRATHPRLRRIIRVPKHLICCSDSFYIGQKIPSLSHTHQLQPGHKYFLLPQHCFQIVLSFVSIASFSRNNINADSDSNSDDSLHPLLKKAATCKAFDIQKTASGCMRIRVSDEFISRLMEDSRININEQQDDNNNKERVCTTPELKKDYRVLVGNSRHCWKPKLETIREKKEKRERSKRKKKKKKMAAAR